MASLTGDVLTADPGSSLARSYSAHAAYKNSIVKSGGATVVTRQSLGYPLRTLPNALSEQFAALEKEGVPLEALESFDRDRMYLGLIAGDLEEGSLISGQAAGLIADIRPVKTIIDDIMREAGEVVARLEAMR